MTGRRGDRGRAHLRRCRGDLDRGCARAIGAYTPRPPPPSTAASRRARPSSAARGLPRASIGGTAGVAGGVGAASTRGGLRAVPARAALSQVRRPPRASCIRPVEPCRPPPHTRRRARRPGPRPRRREPFLPHHRRRSAARVLATSALSRRSRMPHARTSPRPSSASPSARDLCGRRQPRPPRGPRVRCEPSSAGTTATPASSARSARAACSSRSSSPRASPRDKAEALRAPIGLDIGAETPEEIAVAILAEIVAVRRDAPLAWPKWTREGVKVRNA